MVLNLRKNILILNDLSISCRLIRSDRRSLGLEIRKIPEGGAELLIRAPRRMKIAYIEWFINEKERWITEKYLAALVEKPRPQMMEIPEYVTEQWLRTEGAERFQQKTAFWAARMKVSADFHGNILPAKFRMTTKGTMANMSRMKPSASKLCFPPRFLLG